MEWSIQEVARSTGTTSRTLRHYHEIGLLSPSRIGHNGYRFYDQHALVRLQRILLLRELGLGLPTIAEVLGRQSDAEAALQAHVGLLRRERERLDRQLMAVEETLAALRRKGEIEMETMFDGFDHTQHREEVERRWGEKAYKDSARWWESQTPEERAAWQAQTAQLGRDWADLAASGADPFAEEAQALAARHVEWLTGIPGTPAAGRDRQSTRDYVVGLAEMYVADPRFAANYGGEEGAGFVRDALVRYAEAAL